MKYKNPTCLSIDPQTAEEARKWAETERVQLSTYVEIAIQQRNKWHERQEANKIEKQRKCGANKKEGNEDPSRNTIIIRQTPLTRGFFSTKSHKSRKDSMSETPDALRSEKRVILAKSG